LFGFFKLRAKISLVGGVGRAPLAAAVILAIINHNCLAFGTISGYFIFEKFNHMAA
jgi:hypothetical protein